MKTMKTRKTTQVAKTLDQIAGHLELLEETLIYRFLDRMQFAFHPHLYREPESLLQQRLSAHEAMDTDFGRYEVAEEFPFTQQPAPATRMQSALTASGAILRKLEGRSEKYKEEKPRIPTGIEAGLPPNLSSLRRISQCPAILCSYLDFLVQNGSNEDDMQYGSALEHDVMVLQAAARRIHYGAIYVAESKFCSQEHTLRPLLNEWRCCAAAANESAPGPNALRIQDRILAQITRSEVEQRILQRVYDKTRRIQECSESMLRRYLEPESLRNFYADCIIPLTKRGELAYLCLRA